MSVKLKLSGFDQLRKRVEGLRRNAEGIDGENLVPFTELFPDSFIQRNSAFETLQAMLDAGGIGGAEDIKGQGWSDFVSRHTRFSGWDEMSESAAAEWVKAKLNV